MSIKIAILTPNPFPVGNVATNRFSTYAKALTEKGCFVKVFILQPTELYKSINNPNRQGSVDGVHYEFMANTTIWNQQASKFRKLCIYISGIFRAAIRLRREQFDVVLMYTNDPIHMLLFGIYTKIFGLKYVIDKSEYPVVLRQKRSLYKTSYIKLFKLFDGIIVMTQELAEYYSKIRGGNAACFYLPMSVDSGRFNGIAKRPTCAPYFACVFGVHNRDCIVDTIEAFVLFKKRNNNKGYKLYLIGDFENLAGRDAVLRCLNDIGEDRSDIIFTGQLNSPLIPEVLVNAMCLITTPRFYESGGFPTKLGEYLATGNPVIATRVGEIPTFLMDRVNCLLAAPGNIHEIAQNMEQVASHAAWARELGIRGRVLTETVFNVRTYVNSLIDFLKRS